jgi:murein L,D-transpeptidase YafK
LDLGGGLARLLVWSCLIASAAPAADSGAKAGRWLLVDTEALTLTVMQGERPQLTLHNIAIGRYGTTADKRRGDNRTPLGHFRIMQIRRDSDFHRFIALAYPGAEQAEGAYRAGAIGRHELQAILGAHRAGRMPPQNTALGGRIGIHGLGRGDPAVHELLNWTRGCIAVTDEQLDTLLPWIRVGITVEIH